MSHVILHPVHGSEDHRVFIPRNRHHITDAKYDVTGRELVEFKYLMDCTIKETAD